MKYKCEDWVLNDTVYKGVVSQDSYTGQEFSDIQTYSKEIRVFGSPEQIKNLEKKYSIDDAYEFKVEKKGSYWYNIFKDPEATNKEIKTKLNEYAKLYELNNKKPLILRIK